MRIWRSRYFGIAIFALIAYCGLTLLFEGPAQNSGQDDTVRAQQTVTVEAQ